MKNKIERAVTAAHRVVAGLLTLLMLGIIIVPAFSQVSAANAYLTEMSVELQTNKIDTATWAQFMFKPATTMAINEVIEIELYDNADDGNGEPINPTSTTFIWDTALDGSSGVAATNIEFEYTTDGGTNWRELTPVVSGFTSSTADEVLVAVGNGDATDSRLTFTLDDDDLTFDPDGGGNDIFRISIGLTDGTDTSSAATAIPAWTNESDVSTTDDPWIIGISTYTASKAATTASPTFMAFGLITDNAVAIETVVLPHITFSLSSVDLTLLDATSQELDHQNVVYGSHTITVDTNAVNGWKLYYTASALTNGDDSSVLDANGTNTASIAVAAEYWGINLIANTSLAGLASHDVGTEGTYTNADTVGTISIKENYDGDNDADGDRACSSGTCPASAYDEVFFVTTTGSRIEAANGTGASDAVVLTAAYAAAAAATTPSGEYTTTVTWIAMGQF
jgi:hypothetical protein